MATGDQADCLKRLKGVLPPWFGDYAQAPAVSAVLQGLAWAASFVYSLWAYAALQTRIKTATDGWLDMIAGDWFGVFLQRRLGQSDTSYRALILAWIFRERGTRAALIKVLQDVTGRTPLVFEVNRPLDTGAYNVAALPWGYGQGVCGYGTQNLPPDTVFVIAYRPTIGSQQYGVQDADIFLAIEAVRPVTTPVWVKLLN